MTEKVFIINNKGLNIAAVIHRPQVETDKLAILCPGYLDTKDYDHLVELAKELALRGYTVVRFDPTGTWESEGDISLYSTTQYLEDIKSVLEYMLTKHKYGHILLGGHSRGAKVSILYAVRDPRVSVILPIMPSTGVVVKLDSRRIEAEKNGFSLSTRDIPGSSLRKEFKVPYSHIKDNDQYSTLEEIDKTRAQMIFVAGELDVLCPPSEVKEVFDRANEPKKYILMNGMDHEYRHNLDQIKLVNDKIMEALENQHG